MYVNHYRAITTDQAVENIEKSNFSDSWKVDVDSVEIF